MNEIFHLINSMAPYLLLGFLLAGVLHAFVPNGIYSRYLGEKSFRSVFNAALWGIPLPLCSCGVIPTAMSLRKEGASRGATLSFLIATPQTGVDSIIATYSLMGLPFALLRPAVALVTSLLGGALMNHFDNDSCNTNNSTTIADNCCQSTKSIKQKIKSALNYAFVEMMQDIGKWLLLGLVVAGLITVLVPDSFFAIFSDKPLLSMLLVLVFAIPMYLCATGSIPIAVALMLKGLSPGTALVLLMAGPAVNVASILVISKVMGKKTLALYLVSIIFGAIFFGLAIDYLLPSEWFTAPLKEIHSCHGENFSLFNFGCFILLMALLANALIRKHTAKSTPCCQHCNHSNNDTNASEVNALHIKIKGMHCNHCKSNAERALQFVRGIERVEIDLNSGNTTIYGNPEKEHISFAMKKLGYDIFWDAQKEQ